MTMSAAGKSDEVQRHCDAAATAADAASDLVRHHFKRWGLGATGGNGFGSRVWRRHGAVVGGISCS